MKIAAAAPAANHLGSRTRPHRLVSVSPLALQRSIMICRVSFGQKRHTRNTTRGLDVMNLALMHNYAGQAKAVAEY